MHYVERPAKLGNICGRFGIEILERQLDNGRRVDDAAVAFSKATRTGGDRLLTECKNVAISPKTDLSMKISMSACSARHLHVPWPARGLKDWSRFREVHRSSALSARRSVRTTVGICWALMR